MGLIERGGMLGGQAAEIYSFGVDAYTDANGRLIKGIPWEILQRTIAYGQSDPLWEMIDLERMEREGLQSDSRPFSLTYDRQPRRFQIRASGPS